MECIFNMMNRPNFAFFLSVLLHYVVVIMYLFAVKEGSLKNWQFIDLRAVIVMW